MIYKKGNIAVRTKDRTSLIDQFCENQITGTKGFIFKVLEDSSRAYYEKSTGIPNEKCRHATLNEVEAFNSRGIYNIDQIDICPKDAIVVRTFSLNMIGLKQKGDIFKTTRQSLNDSAEYEKGNISCEHYRFATSEERMAFFKDVTNVSEVKYGIINNKLNTNKNENNRVHQGVTNQRREQGNGLYIPERIKPITIPNRLIGHPQRIGDILSKTITRVVKGKPFKL